MADLTPYLVVAMIMVLAAAASWFWWHGRRAVRRLEADVAALEVRLNRFETWRGELPLGFVQFDGASSLVSGGLWRLLELEQPFGSGFESLGATTRPSSSWTCTRSTR